MSRRNHLGFHVCFGATIAETSSHTQNLEGQALSKFYILNNGIISQDGMSGSDQRALNWAAIFKDKSHDITMITSKSGQSRYKGFDCIVTAGGVWPGGIGLAAGYLWRAARTARIMKELDKEMREDTVIYSSSDLLPDAIPAIRAKTRNSSVKWIAGLHLIAPNPLKGFKNTAAKGRTLPALSNIYYFISQRLVLNYMKKHANMVMVSNSLDKNFLLSKGFEADKVIVTYGAVDWKAVNSSAKKEPGFDACYVGRFHPQKGFPDLIEAWKRVCKKYPQALLAVIGNDINFNKIVSKVRAGGMARNIKFLGFLNGAEKFSVIKSSKTCIFPSTYESFGMVAAEAMACGVPVVAYDLPVYEQIYSQGMLKAEVGDVGGLSEHVLSLLTDAEKRKKMSREAFAVSQKFTWDKTAAQILERLI